MKIGRLRTNHMTNPVGFDLERPVFSFAVEECGGKEWESARILVAAEENLQEVLYDTGFRTDIDNVAWELPLETLPGTRYYWKVWVKVRDRQTKAEETGESETAFFETARKPGALKGEFIEAEESGDVDYFQKEFRLEKAAERARVCASALGVYELWVNGRKAGEEYLAPGSTAYDCWLSYQTLDVTELLREGENVLTMIVAPGWYSGYFGYEGKRQIYGKEKAAFCDLEICCQDGERIRLSTDTSWKAGSGPIRYAEIYHGEWQDPSRTVECEGKVRVVPMDMSAEGKKFLPRKSLPILVQERIRPREILHTPAGETVVDLGQNMAGWLAFYCREPAGTKLHFQYGEILQDGNFYRENLSLAKAEFYYVSDGKERWVRPHFTYYGFRYVKVEGCTGEWNLEDLLGEVIYSDMEIIGSLKTGSPLVNRLISNTLWSQKGNFIEVPTDCPQRCERMGWTGDAEVFCGTAACQMEVYPFFAKYGYDMMREQEKYGGRVTMTVPSFFMHIEEGYHSSAWADAATIIPWTVYLYSGDKSILEQQYPSMKMWADYVRREDEKSGNTGLWTTGFHYGDWLALDGPDPNLPFGATDTHYVASCYYYLSTLLTAKAGKVLGKEEAARYASHAERIKKAIVGAYFTEEGHLKLDTQTGYLLALAFGICPPQYRDGLASALIARLEKDHKHLKTGFVGTPLLCKVLSETGNDEMAYTLLLNEDCPGWLYPVLMGATTIWERWDSVLPDGHINPAGMNSLNHYSYGSIVEWIYQYAAGLKPLEGVPGFRKALLAPRPHERLGWVKCRYDSPMGIYESGWKIEGNKIFYGFAVPLRAQAQIVLPDVALEKVHCAEPSFWADIRQNGKNVEANVGSGVYEIVCERAQA